MSDEESKLNQQSENKRQKLDAHEDQNLNSTQNVNQFEKSDENRNQNQVAMAGPSNEEPPSSLSIVGLNIDCLEELFEWLSVVDLLHLRQTCKRLKRIVDYYIKINYLTVGKFELKDSNFEIFRKMDDSSIELIKELDVSIGPEFNVAQFQLIKKMLNKVKTINIFYCQLQRHMQGHFYDVFLRYCNSLKNLFIVCHFMITNDKNWLAHSYPTLERISFRGMDPYNNQISDFRAFFTRNTNIHTVMFTSEILKRYGLSLSYAGIKFDQINIGDYFQSNDEILFNLLTQLYELGFYKKLHLHINAFGMDTSDAEKMILPGLEELRLEFANFKFPSIPDLKKLYIDELDDPNNLENAKNIEKLHIIRFHRDRILYLIQAFPKLRLIKIDRCIDDSPLDLIAMNKERRKLTGACKVIIYIDERIYLATKWTTTKINFDLIELKRLQSFDWEQIL